MFQRASLLFQNLIQTFSSHITLQIFNTFKKGGTIITNIVHGFLLFTTIRARKNLMNEEIIFQLINSNIYIFQLEFKSIAIITRSWFINYTNMITTFLLFSFKLL